MTAGCTPEYNAQTRKMMDDLEALKKQHTEAMKPERQNKAARTRMTNQSDKMREQIASGHAERPGKRPSVQSDPETEKVRLTRDRLTRQVEALIAKGERSNRSLPRKIADAVTAGHLFNMFTSVMVIPKLAAAVAGGHVLALGQMGVTSALKAIIPAYKRFAEQSASQGAGLNWQSLKGRARGVGEAPKTALETLHHGESRFEAAYGDTAHMSDAFYAHTGNVMEALRHPASFDSAETLLSIPGRTHGMIKQFLSQPEFRQAQVDAKLMIVKRMEASGKTPEEIHEYLGRDTTQATVDGIAMARAYEAKMQGKNRLNESVTNVISQLAKSENPAAAVAGWALRQILPVTRVGPNVVKQATSLAIGGIKAGIEKYAKGEMTPERRDYIVKNIAQQGVGLGLLAIGMVYHEMFGGVPGAGRKGNVQKDADGNPIKPDEADIAGIPVGAWGFHGAPASMLQIGAGIVQVFKEEMQKDDASAVNAAILSIGSNLKNWMERTLPYTDKARRIADTLEYARGGKQRGYPYGTPWGEVAGNELRSMIEPLALQQYAASKDEYKKFRKSHSIENDMSLGLPGEEFLGMPGRESVPRR